MTKIRKSFPKRILCALLTAMLLLGMMPGGAFARGTSSAGISEIMPDVRYTAKDGVETVAGNAVEYYGRTALAAMSNSTALLYAYDQIVSGIDASKAEISVYNGKNGITQAEIEAVFDAYRRDHTEQFWIGNSYGIRYTSSTVISLAPSYVMSGAELETAKEAFRNAASELLSGITPAMSEYQREKLLHDRLAAKVSYETTANAHNAYGAIVEGKAVCEGYAEAYQYLLQCAGLQSFIVTGASANPATGTPEGHAWNIVRIDGRYYHVDLTWDDQGTYLFYAYFNKTDARIKEDHTITATAYALPVCNSEVADYFTVNGGKMATFHAATIGAMLKNGGLTARIYVTGDKTAFIEAFRENIRTVAKQAGISGSFSYGYASLGRECILMLAPSGYTVSGTATSFQNDLDDVTIQLIKAGTTNVAYTTTVKGGSTGYSIAGVVAGTYTMQVMKQNHVTREYTVIVDGNVTQNVKIHLLGDVNGDGKINAKDWNKLKAHLNKSALLVDYSLKCADVNGDNKVNAKDWNRMKGHINRTNPLW